MTLKTEQFLKGTPIVQGIAIGRPFFTFSSPEEQYIPKFSIPDEKIEDEISRYKCAVQETQDHIISLKNQLEEEGIKSGSKILESHFQLLQDPLVSDIIEKKIRACKKNVEYVFQSVINEYENKFNNIKDLYLKERFLDIQEMSKKIMSHLRDTNANTNFADISKNSILFTQNLLTSYVAESKDKIIGFVTKKGGVTSHAAILAKAKGMPYISNLDIDSLHPREIDQVIIDGHKGLLIINPTDNTTSKYRKVLKENHEKALINKKNVKKQNDTKTIDGTIINLLANIELPDEINILHNYETSGVGLFRTEYFFLSYSHYPSEEEQFQIYQSLIKKMRGLPITFRTFDIGGDKKPKFWTLEEENPSLGLRAIRFMLKEKDKFKAQIKAILRTSLLGPIKIMFPFVSHLEELIEAKKLVNDSKKELEKEGISFYDKIPIGILLEIPAVAIASDLFVDECDFISIGTNDLVQYALAVDRTNENVNYLYNPLHPGIIRFIETIIKNSKNIPVSICGEMASNPDYIPLLLRLGIRELSVAPPCIPIIKEAILKTDLRL